MPGTGLLAACVPGAFDAWMQLLRDYGTLPLADVLAPAIDYAGDGYPLVWRIRGRDRDGRGACSSSTGRPRPRSTCRTASVPETGTLFRNPALADTYRRIVAEAAAAAIARRRSSAARDAWYAGFVAEAIDRFCRTQEVMDTSGRRHRGLLDRRRHGALAGDARERPLTYDYHGYTVAKCGPWSQGPVLLQQLALLKGFDLDGDRPARRRTSCTS